MFDRRLIPPDVLAVCRRLTERGHQAHLVGGGIRDLLLGRLPSDFDVATSARPEVVMELFGSHFAIPTGLQHGTVTVLAAAPAGPRPVEVTTFRGEGVYVDGRRPTSVTFSATLEEDLGRRDFTMNAIAYDPARDHITDPHGGQGDLSRKLVRAVGDPVHRFTEDGLRPMRAIRQATQLGFDIDETTLRAIAVTLGSFRKVSAERIRDEILKMLPAARPSRGLEWMRTSGLLAEVLPELLEGVGCAQNRFHKFDVYGHTLATLDAAVGDAVVKLGALLHDVGKPRSRQPREGAPGEFTFFKHEYVGAEMAQDVCRRLRLPSAHREAVTGLVEHHMFFYTPDWSDGTVRRFVRRVGEGHLPALMALREADVVGRGFQEERDKETRDLWGRIEDVRRAAFVTRVADLALSGKDVMQLLAIPPGPRVGQVLEALLERVLDDPTLNSRERLEGLLSELPLPTRS